MRAISVNVDFGEWSKVDGFIARYSAEDIFIFRFGGSQFVVVTDGECSMGYVLAGIETVFDVAHVSILR